MKIKLVPKKLHTANVRKDYGKTLESLQFVVKVKLSDGSIIHLKEDEWVKGE